MVQVLYFAWLKSRTGCAEQQVSPPASVHTIRDLACWLRDQSPGHAEALADLAVIRAAVDQEHVSLDSPLGEAREVAFFPPVTGG